MLSLIHGSNKIESGFGWLGLIYSFGFISNSARSGSRISENQKLDFIF